MPEQKQAMLQNRIIGAVAPKGSGKTFSVAKFLGDKNRFVVFDMMRDASYLNVADDIVDGNPEEFFRKIREEEFRLIYRPTDIIKVDDDVVVPSFSFVVDTCYAIGNLWLVIDEAHILCDAHHIPNTLFLATIIGRHRQLNILYITQSFAMVHKVLTRNTDEFWFWKITDPADLEGIKKRCGPETEEAAHNARKLERKGGKIIPGERIVWTVENGLVTQPNDGEQERSEKKDDQEKR